MTGRPDKLEVLGSVVDKILPEQDAFFRSDAERRRFLASLRLRDVASPKPMLKGQRLRVWRARVRAWWTARAPEIIAALIVAAAIGLMALPAQTGLRFLVGVLGVAFFVALVWICRDLYREIKRPRDGQQ